MQAKASANMVRLAPRKARLVVDLIRGKQVGEALSVLAHTNKAASPVVEKVLKSAIANAEHNSGADIDELKVKAVTVDKATSLKRFTARAKGRGNKIEKQTCHITVTLSN